MAGITIQWTAQDTGQSVAHELAPGSMARIGRAPAQGWAVTGDMSISREHADLSIQGNALHVRCLETAKNSILHGGQPFRETLIPLGESFQIGATKFEVRETASAPVPAGAAPSHAVAPALDDDFHQAFLEQIYAPGELKQTRFTAAQQQIEILANLPEVITATQSDAELALTVAQLLLDGIPTAQAVAVAQYSGEAVRGQPQAGTEPPDPDMLKVQTRDAFSGRFRPSRRLLLKALARQESILHIWKGEASLDFTMTEGLGWAFACPVRGEGCEGFCLYVSGKGSRTSKTFFTQEDLSGDLRFTELLTEFIGSIRQVRLLQDQRTQLSAFFSPKVIENLTAATGRAPLAPAERDVTVLFCILSGTARQAEADRSNLRILLQSVSEALGILADGVLGMDGAIADFQGDAVLGFWGWPLPHAEGPLPACQAALRIDAEFRRANEKTTSLLNGLRCGIGITHGRALAGKIGTDKQAKIGVFGPVVNQGSRLVGMTRQFGVSICIDEMVAASVHKSLPAEEARLRFLARVRPKGMETPLNVYSLLPSEARLPSISAPLLATHRQATKAFVAGDWEAAAKHLAQIPAGDGPADFLKAILQKSSNAPPAGWDGALRLESK